MVPSASVWRRNFHEFDPKCSLNPTLKTSGKMDAERTSEQCMHACRMTVGRTGAQIYIACTAHGALRSGICISPRKLRQSLHTTSVERNVCNFYSYASIVRKRNVYAVACFFCSDGTTSAAPHTRRHPDTSYAMRTGCEFIVMTRRARASHTRSQPVSRLQFHTLNYN